MNKSYKCSMTLKCGWPRPILEYMQELFHVAPSSLVYFSERSPDTEHSCVVKRPPFMSTNSCWCHDSGVLMPTESSGLSSAVTIFTAARDVDGIQMRCTVSPCRQSIL